MWPWRVKMPTQNLLRLLLLLMLIVRIMLATVCYRFGSWRLVLNLNFFHTLSTRVGQNFEAGICSAFCRWCFVKDMKLNLGRYSEARFGQDFNFKFAWDQDLCKNLWYDLKKLLWWTEVNPRACCAFGNVILRPSSWVHIRARTEWFEVCGSRKILLRPRWWVSPLILRLACRLLSSSQHGGPGAQVHSSPVNMLTGKEYTVDVGAMCAAKTSRAPPNDKTWSSSATI